MFHTFTLQKKTILFLAVLLVSSCFFIVLMSLGKIPLIDWDEAIYADVAKNTLATSNSWLTLTRFNQPWFEKPPLYIWLIMISMKTFGTSELAIRLPSIALSIVTVLLLYLLVLELDIGEGTSFVAAMILLFSSPFYFFGWQSRMDVPVTATILFSIFCLLKGRTNKKWLLGFGVGIGIGILFKSIIGLLGFLPAFAYSLVYREWGWVKEKYTWLGFGIAALIVAPWHLYETMLFGSQFWDPYLITQVLKRGVTDMQGMTTLNYLNDLWLFCRPWSIVALMLFPFLLFMRNTRLPVEEHRRAMFFGFVSSVLIFSFFAIAQTKMWAYLVPLYPFLSIFVSAGLYYLFKHPIFSPSISNALLPLTVAVLLFMGAFATTRETLANVPKYYFPYVYDEKTIGNYLQNQVNNYPVFLYKWGANESMRFYSGKTLRSASSPPSLNNGPSYLIVISNYLDTLYNEEPSYRQTTELYVGPYLTLLKLP